ncbi:RDD family protein [bacterium]|nr:RDD family protein [bacterium]
MGTKRPDETDDLRAPGGKESDSKTDFDLWRILTTPEEMLEESERAVPATPVVEPAAPPREEVAPAVPEEAVVYCRNHPDVPAIAQCPVCAAYYCNDCLVIKKGRLLCKACAEAVYAPTEEEIIEHGEDAYRHRGDFMPDAPPEFSPTMSGVGAEGRLANVFKRILGYALDILVARVIYILGYVVVSLFLAGISKGAVPSVLQLGGGGLVAGVKQVALSLFTLRFLPLVLILDYIYFFVSFALVNRTFGMSWLNLRIVSTYGDFVGLGACAIRAVVLVVSLGFSIIVALVHPRAMGLHDMAAGTFVVNFSGLKHVDVYESVNVKLE